MNSTHIRVCKIYHIDRADSMWVSNEKRGAWNLSMRTGEGLSADRLARGRVETHLSTLGQVFVKTTRANLHTAKGRIWKWCALSDSPAFPVVWWYICCCCCVCCCFYCCCLCWWLCCWWRWGFFCFCLLFELCWSLILIFFYLCQYLIIIALTH